MNDKKYPMARLLCAALFFAGLYLAGCSSGSLVNQNGNTMAAESTEKQESEKYVIAADIYPVFDWVRELAGPEAEVLLLMDDGIDLHSFKPDAEDMMSLSSCDLFVYVGGESDEWVDKAWSSAKNEKGQKLLLMDCIREKLIEEADGEETVVGETTVGETAVEGTAGEKAVREAEMDEHIWLSLKNAELCCGYIADKLVEIGLPEEDVYERRDAYLEELASLEQDYEETAAAREKSMIVCADRFPFVYLMKDYDIPYMAAMSGCSSDSQASFETIVKLAQAVDEEGIDCLMVTETSDGKISDAVLGAVATGDKQLVVLNSIQAFDAKNGAGENYLQAMRSNLEGLKKLVR